VSKYKLGVPASKELPPAEPQYCPPPIQVEQKKPSNLPWIILVVVLLFVGWQYIDRDGGDDVADTWCYF